MTIAIRRCGRGCVILLIVFLSLYTSAAATVCDKELKRPANDPLGYQRRGNRCEGRYIRKINSGRLTIVSFTRVFPKFDISATRQLRLRWKRSWPEVNVRAESLRYGLHYRMDAVVKTSTEFVWTTDVLQAIMPKRLNLGVVAWIGEGEEKLYVPLRVLPVNMSLPPSMGSYELKVSSGSKVEELYLSVARVDRSGRKEMMINSEPLNEGHYPTGRPITIPVSVPDAAPSVHGRIFVELGASLRGGGSATTEFWFHHE